MRNNSPTVQRANNTAFTGKRHEILNASTEYLANVLYVKLSKIAEKTKSVELPDGTKISAAINDKYKYLTFKIDNYDRVKKTDKLMGYRVYLDKKINDSFCFDPFDQRMRLTMMRSQNWNEYSDGLLTPIRANTFLSDIMNNDLEQFIPHLL